MDRNAVGTKVRRAGEWLDAAVTSSCDGRGIPDAICPFIDRRVVAMACTDARGLHVHDLNPILYDRLVV